MARLTGTLADTSAWIDLLKGSPTPAADKLAAAIEADEPIFLTGLVAAEILRGCPHDRDVKRVWEALSSFEAIEPRYPETSMHAAELFRAARARGLTVRSTVDCVIAALALEHGLAVLHSDRDYAALAKVAPLVEA